ncbi:interferon-inducible GTPase-domain-containing protein [Pisolithus croceorrhizus]|nr:interferon-inducible GTPase-domain-containing protein [Pisolithus croceorrhizus]
MGQVLAIGAIGIAGYGLLRLAWHIWKRLRFISTHRARDNQRLRVVAETKSGKEYVLEMAQLATQDASKASQSAEQAQRQSEAAWRDQIRARRHEDELVRKAEEAKRREQNIQAECNASRVRGSSRDSEQARFKRLEKAQRETRRAQEKVRSAQQASKEIAERARAAQAAAEKAAREAAQYASAAKEAQEEAEERLKRGIQPVVIPTLDEVAAAKTRVQYEQGRFHFAVAGVAGSGKSSFINAIRGVENRHQDAAETGVVETTVAIGRYPDPKLDLPFVWYDIPGAGTLQQPDWLYFNAQGLFVFDCVIVLFDNRFTETDIAILMNCRRFQIPTYIVRSKADVHIRNIMYEYGYDSAHDEGPRRESLYRTARERFIADTRANVKRNLQQAELPEQRVYMVSNRTLLSIVRDRSLGFSSKIIDELELIKDILDEACSPRYAARADDDG